MLVIHGGAGTIARASMTPEMEKQYRETLEQALRAGHAMLMKGGSSLDAVETSIRILEDSPLFNAGGGWRLAVGRWRLAVGGRWRSSLPPSSRA